MLFIDCEEWCKAHNMTTDDLVYAGIYEGVIWQSGEPFFAPYHIRMNLALPLAEEKEALIRLKENVFI